MIAGIDPGYTGAICVWDGTAYRFYDVPLMATRAGKNVVNPAALAAILSGVTHIGIEQVGAMPGQGVSSMFRFGECYGLIQGVAAGLGIGVTLVSPRTWKAKYGLVGHDKDSARTLAIRQYPAVAADLSRKKDIGRADAFWLCRFIQSTKE